jgi:hypothetical protein
MPYKHTKDKQKAMIIYNNSERGFIVNLFNDMFKPSYQKKRKLIPLITKEGLWVEMVLHIQKMKDMFPKSDGRLCLNCFNPWSYVRNKIDGQKTRTSSNLSIDRIDNTKTYVAPNIAFVCSKCNSDKCSMSLRQMKRVRDVAKERGLIN